MALDLINIIEKRLEKIKASSLPAAIKGGGTFYAVTKYQQDVFLDSKTVDKYFGLINFIGEFIHPILNVPLREIHGIQEIKNIISTFLRLKKPNYSQLKGHLLPKRTSEWNIFIRLKWIGINDTIVTPLGLIHPPHLPKASTVTQLFKKKYSDELNYPFVEIRGIKSKNAEVAFQTAVGSAKVLFSQIPNRAHSLVFQSNVDMESFFIAQKVSNGSLSYSNRVSHRGITYDKKNKYDQNHVKKLQFYLSEIDDIKKASPALYARIQQGCIAFQNSKTTDDETTKLLLLVVALDSLLMEKFYRPKHGDRFTRRLIKFSNRIFSRITNPPSTKFLNEIYKLRNTIAHTAKRHSLASKEEYHWLEVITHTLIIELSATKAPSHADALTQLGLLI